MLKDQLTLEEGQLLIKIARENIETYLNGGEYVCIKELPEIFHEKLGVFVTLSINSNLRGCIGYPEPYMELIDGLLDVSIAAAVEDPRFNLLKVGRDGLIIENMYHRGLLLPQVPIEQNWDIETFLENLCYKAGLYGDAWKDNNTKIYSFQAQIFDE